ncbi:hemagglutinin repeat-containing protein [Pseudomonas brassicacearum]|uniref:two-partner secretion domain-containing protein n=1 Tax=Pseudomonas brassicacearum TaxID=930166 RepID=UPI001F33CFA5|nr:hemagglutinin repeat-containing protein [Pseudomonas brassicacearum]
MPKRGLAFLLANVMFWQPMWAQAGGIVVSAPGTSLGQAGNGVPIVNIAKPNGSGLSHNKFKDYNVGSNGVILNNATNPAQATQLGGIILGNPNLKGTAARIILNEVNGGNASQLRGYTEVAGQSAHVIVANPHGITCNGCGFINTPKATLTTGKPIIENGQLNRYQVDQGSVAIEGAGLNANNVDRFEIITRSAKINAEIQAKNLTIVAGRNDVNAGTLNATARADDGSAKPELAIDSSALGGMYAGAIKLVGTEAGVGVKLDGKLIASGGDIQLDANGHLSMAETAAAGAVNIQAQSLETRGQVYAGSRLDVKTQGDLTSQKNLVARDSIHLDSGGTFSNNGIIEAGVNADNSRNTTGDVTLTAKQLNNGGKTVIASRDLNVTTTAALNNQGGTLSGQRKTTVTGNVVDNRNKGRILGNTELHLNAGQVLNSQGGLINSQGLLMANLGHLENNAGELSSLHSATLILGSLDNLTGLVMTGKNLDITNTGAINNQGGELSSQGVVTVRTGSLDNRNKGTVAANGKLLVSATGAVKNTDKGLIASREGALELDAASLDNARGTLQGKGLVTVDVAGDIDNQGGSIIAQDANLGVFATNLDNRGGVLSSVKAALEARTTGVLRNGYDLYRQGGTIQAQGLNIQALAGLFNDGGRMAAQAGDIVISNAGADIDNRSGGMYASGKVWVIGRNLDNSGGGQISASRIDLDLSGALNNNAGIIESQDSLDILAASLSNQKGQLRTLGKNSTTAFNIGGLFDNSDGTLETASQDVGFDTGSVQNVGGKLLHTGLGLFGISQANLGQAGGQLVTYGNLTVTADSWTNSTAIQAGHLVVHVDQLTQTATGQLLSANSMEGRGSNWRVDGLIGSDGAIDLQLTGAYAGNGRLSSLGTLGLKAALINLEQNGSIVGGGSTSVVVDGVLNSYGRLTSATDMSVTAATINNYGTLGSAGALGVSTGDLLNERGLIFSGGNTSLRVNSLTNRYADIYSLGDLSIDRDGLGTRASRILNSSGTLQSDGNMRLAASTIDNVREVLTTHDAGIYTASIREVACIEGVNAGDCSGGKENHVWQIIQRDKFEVTAASAASSITTGGNLNIQGDTLTNRSSSIGVGGALTANLVSLNNIGIETGEIETSRTFMSERTRHPSGWRAAANDFTNKYWLQSPGYNANDLGGLEAAMSRFIGMTEREVPELRTQTVTTDNQTYAAIIQAGGAIDIPTQGDVNSGVVRGGYNYVGAGPRTDTQADNVFSTRVSVNRQLPPSLTQQQVDPLALPGFDLPTGQNGLFRMSGDASTTPTQGSGLTQVRGLPDSSFRTNPQKYLIETNPALTDMRRFMSSDYLLTNLGYDPDTAAKRLGDGFYEQRLIQQAVIARTGQRFLDGQTSDDGMFKYLMNNAIASKDALNLSLGVSLTAEQVAALTHDIVWMETRTVNNEQVLVPVLYLAQANNRLAANGALIQGADVSLIAGKNLNNAGTLRASSNLRASAGDSLVNSGLMEAGGRLDALASNHLTNRAGGVIAGRDVSVVAVAGDLTNERTLTTHASSTGYKTEQRGFADSAARIEASHDLSAGAGRDIANVGGVLKSGNDTTLRAARNMNITAAEQMDSHTQGSKHRDQTITQNGSSVTVGRDLQAAAGGDLNVIASQIETKRNLAIAATQNLTLGPAANEQHSYGKSKKVKSIEDHVQQVSTTLKAGGDATLSAGQDLTLVASTVNAGNEAYLVAGNNLALKAAADQDYSFYSKTKKSSSGKKFRLDETDSTTQVGSLVSSGGNSTLVAGENLLLAGSAVTAEKGATKLVAGKDVQILAVTDSDSARHERKESKSSWGGFKSSKVQDKVDEKRTTAVGSMVSGETVTVAGGQDVKVTGSSLVSTGDLAVQAGRDLTIDAARNTFSRTDMHKEKNRDLTGVLTGNKLGLDDMTGNQHLFINSQKHNGTATETTLTGSTIGSSAGNVTLTAGRELSVVASDLVSTKDMSLNGANVTIAAGTETADQISKDNARSLAVGRVVGGIVVDTVKSIRNDVRAAQQADDKRLKAVKAAQALLSAYNAMRGDDSAANESDGRPANSKGSFIKIGTELANTRKKSTSEYHAETTKQSTLNSGGSLDVIANGNAPDTKGDIRVVGSSMKANDTLLQAKNNITLESAQDRSNWDNQNSTNKTSIGASFNIGEQMGFTLDLGAKMAKGMGTGHDVTHINSTVDTGLLVLKSGQDTTLAGAQVRADAIKADVGANLHIASRQDEASKKNKRTSGGVGVSICVPPFCLGSMVSGSAEYAGSKVNSNYRAVTDQTGLFAGVGGYDIDVGKNTVLQGAVIASEASVDKNHLSTGRLLVSDIKNKSDIKSQAAGLSYSGATAGFSDARSGVGGAIPLMLADSDSSKTRSAVSPGTITVRDAAGANDLVGLNRDTANANKQLDRPDEKAMQERIDLIQSSAQLSGSVIDMVAEAKMNEANKLRKQADAQSNAGSSGAAETARAADAAFAEAKRWQVGGDKKMMADIASGLIAVGLGGATGGTAVGIVANTSASDISNRIGTFADAQEHREGIDSATKAAWAEGGAARILLHALAGAAIGLSSGNAGSGALGAGASAALMPFIGKALSDSGMTEADQDALATLVATGVGAAVGSSNGSIGAVVAGGVANNVDTFNRRLHKEQEVPVLEKKAEELERTLGEPGSSASWKDLLMMAAGGSVNAADEARLDQLYLQSKGSDPESQRLNEDLNFAKGIVAELKAQKIPLTWSDGSPIVANGEKVFAFGATEEQFNDSTLFNAAGLYGPGAVYEQWRQYGQDQASLHAGELANLSSYESEVEDAAQRLSVLAGKGVVTVSPELDAAMLVMPGARAAKTVFETVLERMAAKKAAGLEAEAGVGVGAKGLTPSLGSFNEQNFTLNGQAQFVESRFIQLNTTVRLSEDFTLNTGVVVPKGSVVTVSDDVMKIVEPSGVSSIKSYNKNIAQPLMLTDSGAKTFTLDDVRNLSGREKWEAGETYVQELYGSTGQRYYPVPGTGGRYVDAPVDMPNGTIAANEVKTYQRVISSTGNLNEVPLSEKIYAQIEKDLYLRDAVKGYEPKWIFLEAPPAKELSRILQLNKIDIVIHK